MKALRHRARDEPLESLTSAPNIDEQLKKVTLPRPLSSERTPVLCFEQRIRKLAFLSFRSHVLCNISIGLGLHNEGLRGVMVPSAHQPGHCSRRTRAVCCRHSCRSAHKKVGNLRGELCIDCLHAGFAVPVTLHARYQALMRVLRHPY